MVFVMLLFLSPVSIVSARNASDHDHFWFAHMQKKKKTLAYFESRSYIVHCKESETN